MIDFIQLVINKGSSKTLKPVQRDMYGRIKLLVRYKIG